ncbi:hypothetical protein EK21DRAFT_112699 [Setomelanomma holmii]|uniref:Uncharacterized protein n=1 Tax=Setomelanomma holmii TaxID=210430 RepID=A0A9P4LLC2_9PLEO|nr:hypothetical protein EK21DRAFT_112699 [Setomelanomma holmii]
MDKRLGSDDESLEGDNKGIRMVDGQTQTSTPVPSLSVVQAMDFAPQVNATTTTPHLPPDDKRIEANVTININSTDRKNLSLLKRLSAVITSTSSLDILGPHGLVTKLVAGMQACERDHAAQAAATAHWQKVALASSKELDERPICGNPGHAALKEELDAKDAQVELLAGEVKVWSRKMAKCRQFVEDANKEMRARGTKI